jgi:valyl-tRNA synthetase
VEKQLKEKENKTRHDVGREGLVERIWTWKQQYGDRIVNQLKRLGCSCDWDRTRFTLDEMCARAVRETFFKLFKDGLIYRGKRLVNWDVFLQTSISDDEIYHENVKTSMWHIAYPIEDGEGSKEGSGDRGQGTESISPSPGTPGEGRGGGLGKEAAAGNNVNSRHPHPNPPPEYRERGHEGQEQRPTHMVVATTRPETMLGDTAVAVHSEDPRWNWAIGKHVRLPLTGRLIPIIADDILVDPKFGSGVVKVTPAHDPNDYAVWQRHQGKPDQIDLINILTPEGKINENGGSYAGLRRDQARKQVVEDLTAQGLLVKEEPYETQVGHSDRSKTPIEPYLSDQWFVRMAPLAEPALVAVRNGSIKFFPERHAQQYLSWLGEKRDWPISRQLWWGHRIPVWSCPFTYTADMEEMSEADGNALTGFISLQDEFPEIVAVPGETEMYSGSKFNVIEAPANGQFLICLREDDPQAIARLEAAGFKQDADVLDTWFSSALWPHSTLGWPSKTTELAKWYPTSVLLTGRDIITLWVARMVMMGMYNMGEKGQREEAFSPSPGESWGGGLGVEASAESNVNLRNPLPNPPPEYREREKEKALGIPFAHVAINPTILDGKGERMSKSKGNGVDPVDIIDTHGADALRFTLTQMATETQDVRMPVKKDAQGRNTSDKFDVGKHFCNKIWQVSQHFVMANLEKIAPEEPDETKWSLADRWIVSRFNRTVEIANSALENYRFDQYAKGCYDFFWGDFCDWYVEASKPALRDPNRAGQTATILASVLDGALRLMHPMIPFITEVLFWRLNELRPTRGLPARLECQPSRRLIKAAWPLAANPDAEAEKTFRKLQDLIAAIRNVRTQYGVPLKQSVTVSISAPDDSSRMINDNRKLIELLATCSIKETRPNLPPPAGSTHVTAAECDLYFENLVDPEAEKHLKAKKIAELEKQIAAMKGRLANESYISKAPPQLVQQTTQQLSDAEAELAKLRPG